MKSLFVFLLSGLIFTSHNMKVQEVRYSVPKSPWAESFGNHRAVLKIPETSEIVTCNIEWRRHDKNPEMKRFIIVNAETGDTVPNIFRYKVNNEVCKISFGPVREAGTYYFYYLPYEVQEGWGFYDKDYLKPENAPSPDWVSGNHADDSLRFDRFSHAELVEIQSRTKFDSFCPMEIIPLTSEKKSFLTKFSSDYLVFPEDRAFPIRMNDEIPLKWVQKGPSSVFKGDAMKNEYYAFQLGLFASKKELKNIKVQFSSLTGNKSVIPATAITCFNTGGTDPYGKPFSKQVDIKKGAVQPLWIGIDIPETISAGIYRGTITVKPENSAPQRIEIEISIADKILSDRGDNEPWRHSRLRWLNSTLGIDDNPARAYEPVKLTGDRTYFLTDKKISLAESRMPEKIEVSGTEVLAQPVLFNIDTPEGPEQFSLPENVSILKNAPGIINTSWDQHSDGIHLSGTTSVESDGYINYMIRIRADKDINISDIRLEIPFSGDVAEYMIGMGLPGTEVPPLHESKWEGPYDSFWMGNASGGLWCELRGSTYTGPLLNLYHPAPPPSWYNNNKGGFRIEKNAGQTKAVVYSGSRNMKSGESIVFEWSMLITPVKKTDCQSQFTNRYYHNGKDPMPSDSDLACGVKIVNLHHANNYNPHINYPFIAVDSMKWFINRLHEKGQKVKIYYTIRELTNYTAELWALRSLGNEILGSGNGGGYPWLREHFIDGYMPQWYQHFPDKSPDASIVNAPADSRWYNYYIEGLKWLVKNVDIDGLYLDDVAYDRRIVKRIRKVLDNEKPGCLIDLHSNTGFSKGPANQYTEYFPYIDKLWFGESFQYDIMSPANWFVEVSGIPFGLMGDMLQGGGNRWRGMVYGMTLRLPWTTEGIKCDPRPVWKVWDEFGIESSTMKGYWEKDCPVKTDNPQILATVYRKNGEALISVASWDDSATQFTFKFDWDNLGISSDKAMLIAPDIKDFQKSAVFKPTDRIPVDPKKGWLIYLREMSK